MTRASEIGILTRRKLDTLDDAALRNKERLAKATSLTSYSSMAKASLKLNIVEMQTQLALLESLKHQDDGQNGNLLFSLMMMEHPDGVGGYVDIQEFLDFIRMHHQDRPYFAKMERAIDAVARNESKILTSGKLNQKNFRKYLALLSFELRISYQEIVEVMLNTYFRAKNGIEEDEVNKKHVVVVEEAEEEAREIAATPIVEEEDEEEKQEKQQEEEPPVAAAYDAYENNNNNSNHDDEQFGVVETVDYNDDIVPEAGDDGIVYDNDEHPPDDEIRMSPPDENGIVHYGTAVIPPPDDEDNNDSIFYDTDDDGIVYDDDNANDDEMLPPTPPLDDGIVYNHYDDENDGIVYDHNDDGNDEFVQPDDETPIQSNNSSPPNNKKKKEPVMFFKDDYDGDDDDDSSELGTLDSFEDETPNTVSHFYKQGFIPKHGIDFNKNYGTPENPILFV